LAKRQKKPRAVDAANVPQQLMTREVRWGRDALITL
jgi:hypothetical protein